MSWVRVTLKKTTTYRATMLVTARHWLNTMFPIGHNERYFVAIWTLIRNRVMPSSIR
jgi:hypothetical protein